MSQSNLATVFATKCLTAPELEKTIAGQALAKSGM
jgi:hypothetical protein